MNHQTVSIRIDVRRTGMHDREVQTVGRDGAVDEMVWGTRVLSPWLPFGVAERAHDLFFGPRRLLIGRANGSGLEAPRLFLQRICRRRSDKSVTHEGAGESSATAQEGAAIKQ